MENSQIQEAEDRAYADWQRATDILNNKGSDWPTRIKEACRSNDHEALLSLDPFPDFEIRRNALHAIIFESDNECAEIPEEHRLPIVKAMVELAPDKAEFVNKPDSNGVTPLQMAAMEGHVHIARYLINQGAQTNSKDDEGVTPLHWAADNLRTDMVELLLEHLEGEDRTPYDDEFYAPVDSLDRLEALSDNDKAAAHDIRQQLCKGNVQSNHADLGVPQQNSTNNTYSSQIMALGGLKSLMFDKSAREVLYGTPPVLRVMRDRLLSRDVPTDFRRWGSYVVSLPHGNLKCIKDAAAIIFEETVGVKGPKEAVLGFIEAMGDSVKLCTPGFYQAPPLPIPLRDRLECDRLREVNDILENVYCMVLPILDVTDLESLRSKRYYTKSHASRQPTPRPVSTQNQTQTTDAGSKSKGSVLFADQSLDEYCHSFLAEDNLRERDVHQVVSRYSNNHSDDLSRTDEIVIVSQLRVWRFGDFFLCTYGNDRDNIPRDEKCKSLMDSMFNGGSSLPSTTTGVGTMRALNAIMEACVRYEPQFPRNGGCELLDGAGAFAEEIAREASRVAKSFEDYTAKLGYVDKYYKRSVRQETWTLERLDDALSELAMIRRVHEDLRLLSMDRLNNREDLERWAERSESKLRRLENDALRVRKSLVTLLGLKQREVNTESLISSKFQSQVLVVFTAATVLFTPLSWISSLMALDIKDFSPQDSVWSRKAATEACVVTLVGFVGLMVIALFIWWWVDKKIYQAHEKKAKRDLQDLKNNPDGVLSQGKPDVANCNDMGLSRAEKGLGFLQRGFRSD